MDKGIANEQNKVYDKSSDMIMTNIDNEYEISCCEKEISLSDEKKYQKFQLSEDNRKRLKNLVANIPIQGLLATGAMANAYSIRFPSGLPHTLMRLSEIKGGGFTTSIMQNGKIAGQAALIPMTAQATVMGIFTAMSIATGQFFLTRINSELNKINLKIDEILDFLYGANRAELLSEVKYVQRAYSNFSSIMNHADQRIATLVGLQEAKKVAMKDIEFYENTLNEKIDLVTKESQSIKDILRDDNETFMKVEKFIQNLELSLQLYLMSNILEVFYSSNYECEFLDSMKEDYNNDIKKRFERVIDKITKFEGYIGGCNAKGKEEEKNNFLDKLSDGRKCLKDDKETFISEIDNILSMGRGRQQFYVTIDGELYLQKKAS